MDIERGRTIKGWKPRRLGGGKGGRKSHFVESYDRSARGGSMELDNDDSRYSRSHRDKERKRSKDRSRSRSREKDRKKRSKSRGKFYFF